MIKQKPFFFDMTKEDVTALIDNIGYEPYRASQLWEGIYKIGFSQPDEIVNLPKELREKLNEKLEFNVLFPEKSVFSEDLNTEKILFRLRDDLAVETVIMNYQNRNTVCISTQVGCAMDCKFCATGKMGFKRNLSIGEINAQVLYVSRKLSLEGKKLSNIVVMGMGEPFNNYQNTLDAIYILNNKSGAKIGTRRFTISTVGIVPKIKCFTRENHQINLAISLHAAENSLRSRLLPINDTFSIEDVLEASDEYIETTHRRVSLEWAMIHGVNDDLRQAKLLIERIKGKNYHVNLIPLNSSGFFNGKGSSRENVLAFKMKMEMEGISCSVRLRRGIDIQAGCGQLMDRNSNY